MRRGKSPQNINEELSRMKKLMSFKMGDNSHKKLSEDFIKESTKKRKVVSEQKDVKDTYQLHQTTKDTGWRNVITGIKYDQVDEEGFKKEAEEVSEYYEDNFIRPNEDMVDNFLETEVYPDIDQLIDNEFTGTLWFTVNSGASKLNATNRWDNKKVENPPQHDFGGLMGDRKWTPAYVNGTYTKPKQENIVKGGNTFLAENRGLELLKMLKEKLNDYVGGKLNIKLQKGDRFGVIEDKKFVTIDWGGDFTKTTSKTKLDIGGELIVIAKHAGMSGDQGRGVVTITWKPKGGAGDPAIKSVTFTNIVSGKEQTKLKTPEGMMNIFPSGYGKGVLGNRINIIDGQPAVTSINNVLKQMGFGIGVLNIAKALGGGIGFFAKGDFYKPFGGLDDPKNCKGSQCVGSGVADQDFGTAEKYCCPLNNPNLTDGNGNVSFENLLKGLSSVSEFSGKVPSSISEIQKNLETSPQTMYKDTTKG